MKNVLNNLFYIQVLFLSIACSKGYEDKENVDSINIPPAVENSSVNKSDTVGVVFTGVIQSTGLSKQEKKSLGLEYSDFQLIGNTAFFLEGGQDFKSLWGRCVEIRGKIKEGWSIGENQVQGQYIYGRVAYVVDSIKELSFDKCNFSFDLAPKNTDYPREILTGKIERAMRPAPDIDYDYKLVFEEPYLDIHHNADKPAKLNSILISGYDFSIQKQLEESIAGGFTIEIEGYMEMGYAETSHFRITRVKNNLRAILN